MDVDTQALDTASEVLDTISEALNAALSTLDTVHPPTESNSTDAMEAVKALLLNRTAEALNHANTHVESARMYLNTAISNITALSD